FSRLARRSLALRPAHSRGHQVVTAIRRLQPFRYLHDCSDCFRLERSAGWALHPLESAALSRRTPIAVNPDGSPIIGPAMEEFVVDDNSTTSGALTYPAATLDKAKAMLTMRVRYEDQPIVVAADRWDYTNEDGVAIKLAGDRTPFQQGTLYEFVYQAKNPVVAGIGFAAIRDLASFVRTVRTDDNGNANPLNSEAVAIYTACVSQPCRTMHDFVLLG